MASRSLIYFAADTDGQLSIEITKDVQIAMMLTEKRLGRSLRLVRVEDFETILKAMARLKAIRKMSIVRRRRLVERENPGWKELPIGVHSLVTPTGTEEASWEPYRGDRGGGSESGGVPAKVPRPTVPRAGSDAKLLIVEPD